MLKIGALFSTMVLVATVSGCGHHRRAKEEAFIDRVADRCVEAARSTQIVVVPGGAATTVVPAAEPAR